ncbi:hypothetical protein [Kosakonia sp.]|uniref:hypothetical protein n=1 Tax=Kosakonia sp. TaxID=1916651 RepID=UPI00289C5DD6|nr:hypothetical protein [Kosakonia sp.]
MLVKRALCDGVVPAIDAMVDLYNALSLRYAILAGARILLRMLVRRARYTKGCIM